MNPAKPVGCFLTVDQLAERLGIGRSAAYRLVDRDRPVLAHRRYGADRKMIRVPLAEVERYEAACTVTPLPPPTEPSASDDERLSTSRRKRRRPSTGERALTRFRLEDCGDGT